MALDQHPAALAVLEELHAAATLDGDRWADRTGTDDAMKNAGGSGPLVRLGEFYLAVSPDEGRLLYILARAIEALRIVEFGASFGISSIYLAAAARDNGGTLVTTEVHPGKCAALRETFARAGLSEAIVLLEGDARETLKTVAGQIDLVFLDGWKSAYLPIYNLLRPKMRPGALILADNCAHAAAVDYLEAVRSANSGCATAVRNGLAISCVVS